MLQDFGINMDKKLRGRLQAIIRKDFKKSELYSNAEEKSRIDVKVYQCQSCKKYMYTGVSEKNFEAFKDKYEGIVAAEVTRSKSGAKRAKTMYEIDHVDPVIPYDRYYYEVDMEEFVERTHCSIENLELLCKECHKEKSAKEKTIRSKYKKLRKK